MAKRIKRAPLNRFEVGHRVKLKPLEYFVERVQAEMVAKQGMSTGFINTWSLGYIQSFINSSPDAIFIIDKIRPSLTKDKKMGVYKVYREGFLGGHYFLDLYDDMIMGEHEQEQEHEISIFGDSISITAV